MNLHDTEPEYVPMSDFDPSASVTEQASYWCVLFRGGRATRKDKRTFAKWVSQSPECVAAYLRVIRLTGVLSSDRPKWPDTSLEELISEARQDIPGEVINLFPPDAAASLPGASRSISRRRMVPFPLAIAAALVLVVASTWIWIAAPQRYATVVGEQRSIVLKDGSVVTLNTSSEIEVHLAKSRRTIELLAGEALFQVAHDRNRPFYVMAGRTAVRAVGTQFNVDRRATSTTVTVVEGKVSVEDLPENPRGESTQEDPPVQVSAGEAVIVQPRMRPHPTVVNTTVATAWTQRRLIFGRRPLGEVAEEFNRYNRQEIHIESEKLRDMEVTGVVQVDDPNSFLEFISKIPGVKIERGAYAVEVLE